MQRPNILLVMTDQHNADYLGCMGHPVLNTPNIDRMANEGLLFRNAYTPSPVCAPARCSVFSGRYPYGCGVPKNWIPFRGDCVLFPEQLQNAGYETAMVGKLHFVPHAKRWGFEHKKLHDGPISIYADDSRYSDYVKWLAANPHPDIPPDPVRWFDEDELQLWEGDIERFMMGRNFIPESHHMTTWTADSCLDFLERRDADRPFFLYAGFFAPHQPWAPPEPWRSMYDAATFPLADTYAEQMEDCPVFQAQTASLRKRFREDLAPEDVRRIMAAYAGNISMIDHHVGRIFDALRAKGLWEDTLVIFTADHGEHGGHYGTFFKGDMYDSSARVPLVVKPPQPQVQGEVERTVGIIDLYGGLLDAAGAADWRNENVECDSLYSLFESRTKWKEPGEARSIIGLEPDRCLTMLRRGPLKLIRLARGEEAPLYELFDMGHDPREVRNLYDHPDYRVDREALRQDLDGWWLEQKQHCPEEVIFFSKRDIEKFGPTRRIKPPHN